MPSASFEFVVLNLFQSEQCNHTPEPFEVDNLFLANSIFVYDIITHIRPVFMTIYQFFFFSAPWILTDKRK